MKRILTGASLTLMAACTAFAQGNPPAFEVASIKPAAPQEQGKMMVRMGGDAGRVDYANVSLKDVLARAYDVKRYQIRGPAWLDSERYDITAKVPDGVPKEQIPAMLQALLSERFRMTIHRESKDEPVYALIVGKGGPKLTKSEAGDGPVPGPGGPPAGSGPGPSGGFAKGGPGGPPDPRGPMPKGAMMMQVGGPGGNARMRASGATMGRFCDMLSNMLDRPVIDMTQLDGNYDIELDVSMEELAGMKRMAVGGPGPGVPGGGDHGPAPDAAPAASIFSAVQTLGLKLDPRKAPVAYVMVDKADKVPTEN
jgi:uncharacterized protein (TIGR03435 family)